MRIIAGNLRGKRLIAPPDVRVRPTSDKVKESIFNMIAAYVPDAVVLDGFSGTGSLGLEALSRGAGKAYFVDSSRRSISLIRQNISNCRMQEKSRVILSSFKRAATSIDERFDIILLDPPYAKELLTEALVSICEADIIKDDGIIIAEHPSSLSLPDMIRPPSERDEASISPKVTILQKTKERRYSSICVTLYEKSSVSGDI